MSLSLTLDNLSRYTYNNWFVETGTFTGGGIEIARLVGFKRIRSIEIYEPFYRSVRERYAKFPEIELYLGDAETSLWDMIKDIDENITFFLDSHVVEQTGNLKGIREIPLLQELDIIERHPINTHTILIDDRRMMGFDNSHPYGWVSPEWKGILENTVMEKIFSINSDYKISYEDTVNGKKDIIVAQP